MYSSIQVYEERKITLVQNVCCRVLHCVCDGKWIYNCQQIDPDIVLLFIIAMHDPTIYLIWPPRSTSNVYRYKYVYKLPLNIHSHKSPWLSRLGRHSSKPEVVGSNPLWARIFHFVILALFAWLTPQISQYKWNQPWHTPSLYPVLAREWYIFNGSPKL